jgi:predicted enzyme related to lactoylglutathione lyase
MPIAGSVLPREDLDPPSLGCPMMALAHTEASEMQGRTKEVAMSMDWKLELVPITVSDVDRAKAFYAEKVGFDVDLDVNADDDHRVSDEMRVVQLTPPGSACSIAFGTGIVDTPPGSVQALHLVVSDINAARAELVERG